MTGLFKRLLDFGRPYRRSCCYWREDSVACNSAIQAERQRCEYHRNVEAAKQLLERRVRGR